jgi:hypothetical protein
MVTQGMPAVMRQKFIRNRAIRPFPSGLSRDGWQDYVVLFHDGEEIGRRMRAHIARHTSLKPEDL